MAQWIKAAEMVINKLAQTVAYQEATLDFLFQKAAINGKDELLKEYQEFLDQRYGEDAPQVEIHEGGPDGPVVETTDEDRPASDPDQSHNDSAQPATGSVEQTGKRVPESAPTGGDTE